MTTEQQYKVRFIRGAFKENSGLDQFNTDVIEDLGDDPWISIETLEANLEQIKELQQNMVRHFVNQSVPWYMDGYALENKDKRIVAFGADDGEGGRIFEFSSQDRKAIADVISYGVDKGIPKDQMDFMEIDF